MLIKGESETKTQLIDKVVIHKQICQNCWLFKVQINFQLHFKTQTKRRRKPNGEWRRQTPLSRNGSVRRWLKTTRKPIGSRQLLSKDRLVMTMEDMPIRDNFNISDSELLDFLAGYSSTNPGYTDIQSIRHQTEPPPEPEVKPVDQPRQIFERWEPGEIVDDEDSRSWLDTSSTASCPATPDKVGWVTFARLG